MKIVGPFREVWQIKESRKVDWELERKVGKMFWKGSYIIFYVNENDLLHEEERELQELNPWVSEK
jgi:hypothetical protein